MGRVEEGQKRRGWRALTLRGRNAEQRDAESDGTEPDSPEPDTPTEVAAAVPAEDAVALPDPVPEPETAATATSDATDEVESGPPVVVAAPRDPAPP